MNVRLKSEGRSALDVLQSMDDRDCEQPMVVTVYSDPVEKNAAVEFLESVLAAGRIWIPCKNCRLQILVPLESSEIYQQLLDLGQGLVIFCPHCRAQLLYSPYDVLGHFDLSLLEKNQIIVRIDFSAYSCSHGLF